ncbi:terminase [Phytomonospora sp. NPDC050363]|uniref:terminase n=1 Tax=Phytomonospora sp. NPDC050363 TaxID=3155642 RepID=UPI00340B070E
MTTTDAPSATTRVEPSTGAILTGPAGLPARTLGWAVLAWTIKYLRQPDGPDAGKPWRFSAEQVRFLLWFYALDAFGRFTYRRAIYRRSKGHGKDPLAAALALIEFLGPCRYGGTTDAGDPIAIPHSSAWVQLAAVSEAQTNNTMSLVLGMLEGSPAVEVYGLDIGKTIIYSRTGKLQTVTSSPRSMEGNRPSFALLNEVQHWLSSNDGHAMADVIRRNLGKSRDGAGRSVEICNAHVPGEESVGEKSYEAWQSIVEGRSQASGILYDSREAPPTTDMSDPVSLRAGLAAAYGDSAAWVDLDRIAGEIWDPGTPASTSRRYYLNQVTAAEDAWTTAHDWDACALLDALAPGDLVTIGGDGSRSDDSTALAVCRVPDGLLDLAAVWEQPDGPAAATWEVPRAEVDAMMAHLFGRYRVLAAYWDVAGWESYIDKWSVEYGDVLAVKASSRSAVGWDMRSRTKEFVQRGAETMHAAILDGTLIHTGHPVLRRHVLNARRRPNRWGVGWGTEHRESARKVDALAAATLARIAR